MRVQLNIPDMNTSINVTSNSPTIGILDNIGAKYPPIKEPIIVEADVASKTRTACIFSCQLLCLSKNKTLID